MTSWWRTSWRASPLRTQYITKIIPYSIFLIEMECISCCKETHKWAISSSRGNIISKEFLDVILIQKKYLFNRFPYNWLSKDRGWCCSNNWHISIKGPLDNNIILETNKNLNNISTGTIFLTMMYGRMINPMFIRWILTIFYNKSINIGHTQLGKTG